MGQTPPYPNYARFTDRSRKVMELANAEARRFKHERLSTGHILVALRSEGSGVAAVVLKNYYDLTVGKLRNELKKARLLECTDPLKGRKGSLAALSMSQHVAYVLSKGVSDESNRPGYNYIGTEHLLLAMSQVNDCTAARMLLGLGINLDDLRLKTRTLLGYGL